MYKSLTVHVLLFLMHKHLGVQYLDGLVGQILTFKKLPKHVPHCLYHFTFLGAVCESSSSSTSFPTLGMVSLFNFNNSNGYVLCLMVGLICISLMTNYVDLFMCLIAPMYLLCLSVS